MHEHNPVMPHGKIEEVFPNVFFVQGTYVGEFFGNTWTFGRNMVALREGDTLTLVNAVRLDDEGLAALDALGTVRHVVKIGSMHGHDDRFYVDRYQATYWALPGMPHADGLTPDRELTVDGELPVSGARLFVFEQTKLPEAILLLERDGGIAIACDALQNWVAPDPFTDEATIGYMRAADFFKQANLGPAWMMVNEPKPDDFARLKQLHFEHALCGHGSPLQGEAAAAYHATFHRLMGV